MSEPRAIYLLPTDPDDTALYEVLITVSFKVMGRDVRSVKTHIGTDAVCIEGAFVGPVTTWPQFVNEVEEA